MRIETRITYSTRHVTKGLTRATLVDRFRGEDSKPVSSSSKELSRSFCDTIKTANELSRAVTTWSPQPAMPQQVMLDRLI
ncbi:hypothetical protein EVAR_67063_1 [Eumeta japonica]|uniref:Uncharacterized protein n=1 Tax=Eumeta variegata TaxID=151549 RepID=A0A4C1ZIH1_EUMVA|nr:hypothetical protein EVAR_67063_1 [Eumeta japonica]